MGGLAQNVQKTPPGKNVQKSQGQIFQECQECQGQIFQECVECQEFQECQGQISQGQMPRSNIKVKFPKVKWESVTKIKKP